MFKDKIKISERRKIVFALFASIIILIALGIYVNLKIQKYRQSMHDINVSVLLVTEAQNILNSVQDLQSTYQSYIITKDSVYASRFNIGLHILNKRLNDLSRFKLERSQQNLVDTVKSQIERQNAFSYGSIVKRKYDSFDAAKEYIQANPDHQLVSSINYNVLQFIDKEKKSQTDRIYIANKNFKTVVLIVTISAILSIIIIFSTLLYVLKIYKRLISTEKLLLKSQMRLENILDMLPIGIVVVNANNNEYHANHRAVELLGNILPDGTIYETPSSIYDHHLAYLNRSVRDTLLITKAMKGEENIGFDEAMIYRDDQPIPLRVSATPLYNEANNIEYAISVFDDITNIKNTENELINAKKLVEDSLKLKDSFLTNMSHEIRTPMNAILGFAELLAKKDLGTQENEYINTIRSAGETLLRLLNDILDFSKLDANMMVFEENPVSIRGVLESLCTLYQPRARNKGIVLSTICDDNIPELVLADNVRLTQVITNIVSNAIKFTEEGSVTVHAKLLKTEADIYYIQFDVKDSGIGIPKDKIGTVFKRFQQAGRETARIYGGTGLGLSIAKHIVESQGGEISVSSELGIGSVFTFYLPFKKFNEELHLMETIEETNDYSFLNHLHILLVEDNVFNIKLTKGIFMDYSIYMDLAEYGGKALEKLRNNPYDIILMDIELPDMNGYEIARIAREEYKINTPIIALTAHALAGEREKCLQAGMNDYLTKPINTKILFEKMHHLIRPGTIMVKDIDPVSLKEMYPEKDMISESHNKNAADNVINFSYLQEISGGNKEFEKEIIEIYLSETTNNINLLQDSFSANDYNAMKMVAHKSKSAVAVIVGDMLKKDFELIEQSALNKHITDEAYKSLNKIVSILNKSIIQLQRILVEEY